MSHPLLQRLQQQFGYPLLSTDTFDAFTEANEFSVLFFTDDPDKQKETLDVAVVLPELVGRFPQLAAAVIERASERELQQRFNFVVWPALVFLRRGQYLGNIVRIQNWDDYVGMIADILERQPQPLAS